MLIIHREHSYPSLTSDYNRKKKLRNKTKRKIKLFLQHPVWAITTVNWKDEHSTAELSSPSPKKSTRLAAL